MPTHIFTRLGLWDECISWNLRSARAARAHPVHGQVSLHYLHALDYLAYAYLQTGQDAKASAVADSLAALPPDLMIEIATPYTLAAVPARLALERRRWNEAASLPERTPASYPWEQFPAMEALTHFARALGAAHMGDTTLARRAIGRLEELERESARTSPYWATQVRIQALAARAWTAWAAQDTSTALSTMQKAADLEASTEKHPVTPGELLPARELLGDMLLDLGQPTGALEAYRGTLVRSPGRLNAVLGAARAAEAAGRKDAAGRYYTQVVELIANADPGHPAAQAARTWLASRSGR
jgi:tetratricopeptide (TPR) repeat protein